MGNVTYDPRDAFVDGSKRVHIIAQLLDNFFQPLAYHIQLEIQHLSRQRSGGIEQMLNFFVTLVNVIGLPVVMVGTPKARPIFETDLR